MLTKLYPLVQVTTGILVTDSENVEGLEIVQPVDKEFEVPVTIPLVADVLPVEVAETSIKVQAAQKPATKAFSTVTVTGVAKVVIYFH